MTEVVLRENRGRVTVVTLNRPDSLNAINGDMITALNRELEAAQQDTDTHVILLQGAGRAFCSGDDLLDHDADLGDLSAGELRTMVNSLQDITRRIVLGPKVVVAAVHGWAVGGGLEWVINCDLSVWSEDAAGFFPELKWGMFVTGGISAALPRLVGPARARQMIMGGRKYQAADFLNLGIAAEVVPEGRHFEAALELADKLAALPKFALRQAKKALNHDEAQALEQVLERETDILTEALAGEEVRNLIRSFRKD